MTRLAALQGLPWVPIAVTTLVAALGGVGASVGLGVAIAPPSTPPPVELDLGDDADPDDVLDAPDAPATSPTNAGTVALSEQAYLDAINGRNLFDKSKIGVDPDEEVEEGGIQESTLSVKLKGTIVAEPATFSAAFIQIDGQNTAYAYGTGQFVLDAEVKVIERDRVMIQRHGREEWLLLKEAKDAGTKTTAAPSAPTGEGIAQAGDNTFEIEKSFLDEQLSDLAGLSRMARALLHRGRDGEYDGYRLSAIRRGSLPDKLGIRNGDIVHSVNGMDLNSVDGAMKALEALRSEPNLKVKVTRRGQPVDLEFNIK